MVARKGSEGKGCRVMEGERTENRDLIGGKAEHRVEMLWFTSNMSKRKNPKAHFNSSRESSNYHSTFILLMFL